jgi:hypothetical protein
MAAVWLAYGGSSTADLSLISGPKYVPLSLTSDTVACGEAIARKP